MKALQTLIICALSAAVLTGCKSVETVVVERVERDTLRTVQMLRDSIYISDSTIIREGRDTVTVERLRTQHHWHVSTDTFYRVRVDSIPYAMPYPVEVERDFTTWQRVRMGAGDVAMLAVFFAFWIWVAKRR